MVGRRFGMAILPAEKTRLQILARRRGLNAQFAPLTKSAWHVTLYQFANRVCPFLDRKTSRCTIYRWRPLACKMYPLHPYGVSDCKALSQLQKRGYKIVYSPHLKVYAHRYIREVIPLIQGAEMRFNLALGRWEPNRPFTFKSTYGSVK
jgi:Fe-S-cluster containining protein